MRLLCVDLKVFRNEPVYPEDPQSVHHPVPDRVRVVRLCRQTDEQHRDRNREQNNRKMGEEEDRPEQYPGPAEVILLREHGYDPV